MSDIIGIGSSLLDTLMMTNGFPMEDTKMAAERTLQQGGGPVATALVAAAKLGASVSYMGFIGADSFGMMMMDEFKAYGVGTDDIKIISGVQSSHSFVLVNRVKSTRTCVYNMGTIPQFSSTDINYSALKKAKIIHLDGHMLDAAIAAAKFGRENGITVSYDAGGNYPGVEGLLPYVDILIPSEEYALKATGMNDAVSAMIILEERYHPKMLVITQGVKGGIFWNGVEPEHYEPWIIEAVDTNGAGDVFHGAFLVACLDGMETGKACRFAGAVSALKCKGFGARISAPDRHAVDTFMNI